MARELSFWREKYDLWDDPKFSPIEQLDKKSTFWPYLTRVFGFNSNMKGFNCCNFLIHHPIVLHLFITLFWLWNSRFAHFFWIFLDFDICFYALIRAEQNTVSTPITCQLNYLLNHSYSIYFTHYLSTLLFCLPIRQVGPLPNWVTNNPSSYEEILDGFLNP